jgi:hypothetical protein
VPVHLQVEKRAGEIVLLIANGSRPHYVVKSSLASGLDAADPVEARGGTFREQIEAGPSVVFYRVE